MKRIFAILLTLCMLMALTACGSNAADTGSSTESPTESNPSATAPDTEPDTNATVKPSGTSTDPKSIVVYFSWSGNTENVAKSIQSQTGSDIFEIVPKTPYSTDYNTVVDDAKVEQQNQVRPEIEGSIENLDAYDTVYVGFPNWWGDMPMILYTFFDTYDLSGKTVALFCTSGGSGLSNTVNEVKDLEPNATVTEGLAVRDNAAADPDAAVADWLQRIA